MPSAHRGVVYEKGGVTMELLMIIAEYAVIGFYVLGVICFIACLILGYDKKLGGYPIGTITKTEYHEKINRW